MIIGISGKIGSGKDLVGSLIQYHTRDAEIRELYGGTLDKFLDTFAPHHPVHTWKIRKFAGKLKQIVSMLTGYSLADLEKTEIKNKKLGKEWNCRLIQAEQGEGSDYIIYPKNAGYFDMDGNPDPNAYTVRQLLQRVGTEAMRETIHEDVWVNALMADYIKSPSLGDFNDNPDVFPNWIITDVRFPNEAEAIKKAGGILIRMHRDEPSGTKIPKGSYKVGTHHSSETALDNYKDFDYHIYNDGTIDELSNKIKEILLTHKLIN